MTREALERGRVLELAQEVGEAIDQLWAAGKVTVVLRLLLEDCERLLHALRAVHGAADSEVALLEALCQTGRSLGTPVLERELGPAHRELLGRLAAGRRRCVARLRGLRTRFKRLRRLAVFALASFVVVVAFLLFRDVPTVRASAVYSGDFRAGQALDGLTKTEWLLPDKQSGWLELTFSRPRAVESLRLSNASNSPYDDRGTKGFKIEAFAGTRLAATATGRFLPVAEHEGPLTIPLAARDVTHVRITLESFYGLGAGLAEVQVRRP
jgi:hypothetical protein